MSLTLNPPAAAFDVEHGHIMSFDGPLATTIYGLVDEPLTLWSKEDVSTAYGMNYGTTTLRVSCATVQDLIVPPYWYFSIPFSGALSLIPSGRTGKAMAIVREGFKGVASVGGPVEGEGRLRYIDGCSDSVLISPPVLGDPVYNLLHFPKGITQTPHTHPSIRAGVIHEGAGVCITENGEFPLLAGKGFILWPDAVHSFNTREQSMTLTVFHPDSDCGPAHDNHPMLNRTIVDGTSARYLDEIRTKA